MKLTDRKILGAKPKSWAYDIREQDNLVLRVYPSGRKVFQYVPRVNGKEKRITIGQYPVVTLAEARQRHFYLKRTGYIGEKKTFKQIAQEYLSKYKKSYADGGKEISRILEKDVLPSIGKIKIDELKKKDILPILDGIISRGSPRQSNITAEKISVICRFACRSGYIDINPCDNIPKAPENEPRQIVLTGDQIRDIIISKNNSEMDKVLYLMLLTGQRGGECLNIKHEDIKGKWWECTQRKGGRLSVKRVYLSCGARKMIGNGSGRVFGLSSLTKPATHVKRKGVNYTPHDIRRTVSTRLAELGYDDYLINRFLGHSVDKITRTYNVYRYDKQLREMSIVLAKHLEGLLSQTSTPT